jgi:hypothetical protein
MGRLVERAPLVADSRMCCALSAAALSENHRPTRRQRKAAFVETRLAAKNDGLSS